MLDVTTEKAMEEQLLRMSVSDALTGMPNRRAFDQALRGEWRRASRAREPLSVVVDVDRVKQFNDRFGHVVGDQALIAVARALSAALGREGDLVARYGGEEFAVILPGADLSGAALVGRRLIEAVSPITVRQAPDWTLSVSVGTTTWRLEPPSGREGGRWATPCGRSLPFCGASSERRGRRGYRWVPGAGLGHVGSSAPGAALAIVAATVASSCSWVNGFWRRRAM